MCSDLVVEMCVVVNHQEATTKMAVSAKIRVIKSIKIGKNNFRKR